VLTASSRRIRTALAASIALLALSGCASAGPSASVTDEPSATPSASPEAPWGSDDTPTAVIEFEEDGESHTLSHEIPSGLLSCSDSGVVVISSRSPDPIVGVSFRFEPDTPIDTSVWMVDDEFAVQLQAEGIVTAVTAGDGSTVYSAVGMTARASVQPRDPEKPQIGDYTFSDADDVAATASFTVTCPADEDE
jgi:hypothetical protein